MRNAFAKAVSSLGGFNDRFFLTGDLGFMALEEVQLAFGERFVNAGVAEQNMISVAAGLAREGYRPFVYSIAPFCYARPFEQIRNDVCLGRLPVCMVGNGGGYAYGYMGPTHHALEDCAAMNALGVRVIVPAFDDDVLPIVSDVFEPTYLRLGLDARPKNHQAPAYSAWRELLPGKQGALVALGPISGLAWEALINLPENERPSVWAVCEFAFKTLPDKFLRQISEKNLYVLEEHVCQGGLGSQLSYELIKRNIAVAKFVHRFALGYPTGRYGSQNFHRIQCGLDVNSIFSLIRENIK